MFGTPGSVPLSKDSVAGCIMYRDYYVSQINDLTDVISGHGREIRSRRYYD